MGIIHISSPTARLAVQPSTPVRQIHTPNHAIANLSGVAERRNQGNQAIARGLQDLGRAALNISLTLEQDRQRAEDAEIESAFERHLRSSFMGMETKDTSENPLGALAQESGAAKGILTRMRESTRISDLQAVAQQGGELISDKALKQFLDDHEYSRKNRDAILLRMQRVARPWENHLQMGYLGKSKEITVAQADALFQEKLRSWKGSIGEALDPTVVDTMTKDVADCFIASQEARGVAPEKVMADLQVIKDSMAKDYASTIIGKMNTETEIDAALTDIDEDPKKIFVRNGVLAKEFATKDPFTDDTKVKLKTELEQRRQVIKSRKRADVAYLAAPGYESANTIWDPADPTKKNPNRLSGVERAIEHLTSSLNGLDPFGNPNYKQGSEERAYLEDNLRKLNDAADAIEGENLMLRLINGAKENPKDPPRIWNFEERDEKGKVTKEGGLAPDILPGSRAAHLAERIQAQFDANTAPLKAENKRIETENHKMKIAEYKLQQLAGAADRQEYKKMILDSALSGEISVSEWMELNSSFDEAWTKGDGKTISQRQIYARDALTAIQKEFGGDLTAAYQFDPKSGAIKFDSKSGYKGLNFEVADRYGFWSWKNWLGMGEIEWTTTHYLNSEDVRELAEAATSLYRYNGQALGYDPVTLSKDKNLFGEKIDPSEKFDAGTYFKKFVHKMRTDKYVEENVDYVDMLTEAVTRLEARDAEKLELNRKAIAAAQEKTKPTTQKVIKKPDVKSVGVAPRK